VTEVPETAKEEFESAHDGAERHLPKPGMGGFSRANFVRPHSGVACIGDVYELGKKLGSGAFGAVYEATHKETEEHVAIKSVVKGETMDKESMALEVKFMRISDHPNIIRLYETFEDETYFYFVMERCSGGELWQHVLQQHEVGIGISDKELANIMKQMLRAVAYCHAHSIVHRDLKPENFIWASSQPGAPLRLVDFGVSGIISQKVQRFLVKTIGTDGYMAPEVLSCRPYGPAADMFSLGAVMHAIVTGAPPRWQPEKQAYTFPGKLRWRMLSEGAKSLLTRLLEVDPAARPTASEALRDPWIEEMEQEEGEACLMTAELVAQMQRFAKRCKLQRILMESTVAFADRPTVRSSEMRAIKEMFLQADTDGNGTIDVQELIDFLQKCPMGITQESASLLVAALDASHQGTITFSEWLTAAASQSWFTERRCTRRAFDALDVDGDGCISASDLEETLPGVFQPGEIEQEIEHLGMTDRFPLTFDSFREVLCVQASESESTSPHTKIRRASRQRLQSWKTQAETSPSE